MKIHKQEEYNIRVEIDLHDLEPDFNLHTQCISFSMPGLRLDWPAEDLAQQLFAQGYTAEEVDKATDAYFGSLNDTALLKLIKQRQRR